MATGGETDAQKCWVFVVVVVSLGFFLFFFFSVTSVERMYSRFPSWKLEEYVGSVKGGWGEGNKQEIQTKGNWWCKLMPFLSDIDKFLPLLKQSK